MDTVEVMRCLEIAWARALPGRQVAERYALWRALWRSLQEQPVVHEPARLRVVTTRLLPPLRSSRW